jgi:hypothetical protein
MNVFAKRYPARLQVVVKHAERFCSLLDQAWCTDRHEARVWLVGRQEEVELVVTCLVSDWENGRVDEEGAVRSVGAYLRALHFGARGVLEAGDTFACCGDGGEAATVLLPQVDLGALTRFVSAPSAEVGADEAPLASDTIAVADSAASIAEWLAKPGRT